MFMNKIQNYFYIKLKVHNVKPDKIEEYEKYW